MNCRAAFDDLPTRLVATGDGPHPAVSGQDRRHQEAQATEETALGKAGGAAAKHRSDAASQRAKITPRTSDSMARSYQRAAAAAERRAAAEDSKVSKHSKKLGQMATDLAASVLSARL
jgi:hypothetical protein